VFIYSPQKKDERNYSKIFRDIVGLGANRQGVVMNPTHLTCDFEISAINAFKNVFPGAQLKHVFSISHKICGEKFKIVLYLHILLVLLVII
jgi:hypothetical protein